MDRFAALYKRLATALNRLQSLVLLAIRVVMGVQFSLTGWGKLGNIEGVTQFFTSLGLPLPGANAWLVACSEFGGGIVLLLGLASRLTMVPLVFMMGVAYATSDKEALASSTFLAPDPFLESAPFPYLMAALLVAVFGPGKLSVDALVGWWWRKRKRG